MEFQGIEAANRHVFNGDYKRASMMAGEHQSKGFIVKRGKIKLDEIKVFPGQIIASDLEEPRKIDITV